MQSRPVPETKHRTFSLAIRVVDIVVYLAALAIGTIMAAQVDALVAFIPGISQAWVGYLWATMLGVGGLIGFLGRLSRRWLIEVPATVAVAFGLLLCAIVALLLGVWITGALSVIAFAAMFRRWLELQLFASQPGDWRCRLTEAAMRRTANTVRHD